MAVFGKTTQEQASVAIESETPKVLCGSYANGILRKPRITEKAYSMNAQNRYVFEVSDSASKPQIKRAVESVYGVHVVSVNTVSLPSRVRRFGRAMGRKSGVKKAMVEIKEGESLTLFQAGM
ncbi:MAG: large subunit ribosomal protein [Patescibacteria group bacterium]|jgi:large subunit ribosomal protein L23|nr:large subunit ribosomal protein [Patescibacteria group bacterium]